MSAATQTRDVRVMAAVLQALAIPTWQLMLANSSNPMLPLPSLSAASHMLRSTLARSCNK